MPCPLQRLTLNTLLYMTRKYQPILKPSRYMLLQKPQKHLNQLSQNCLPRLQVIARVSLLCAHGLDRTRVCRVPWEQAETVHSGTIVRQPFGAKRDATTILMYPGAGPIGKPLALPMCKGSDTFNSPHGQGTAPSNLRPRSGTHLSSEKSRGKSSCRRTTERKPSLLFKPSPRGEVFLSKSQTEVSLPREGEVRDPRETGSATQVEGSHKEDDPPSTKSSFEDRKGKDERRA